ncbi:MAG: hypothetical protein ACI861_000548 [Paracoccaceae bacterium]|jgi:uncharacterized protein (TIGR01244 family)
MQINQISPDYSVAAQISKADVEAIAKAGFKSLICNRPDEEIEPDLNAAAMALEAKKHGLSFVYNPISNQGMTQENLDAQARAMAETDGSTFAYCRSGTRCAICWSFVQGSVLPSEAIIEATASAGYNLEHLRPHLQALATQE